jgi:predicted Rossmann fold flavoprotein|uniref:NAD(P)/FAD-dependent oxidoreductase n=1 Tax=Cephaloticoccus sp. TaxID=1985742 RepID=UPI00404A7288
MGSPRVVIIGGGAAGFFAAITCAEANPAAQVTLYEATAHLLAKVKISGGGRCNVTHACFEPRELAKRYPRGGRELLGAFHRWSPKDTIAWFAERGVELKTEGDGRMFPITDDSATIMECLQAAAAKAGVEVITRLGLRKAESVGTAENPAFWLTLTDDSELRCDRLLIATGGNRSSVGLVVAERLGHAIEPTVPSLFTFHIDDKRLEKLSGIAVENVTATVPGTKLQSDGPLLITHWGLSGPAVLKLSAWGARELAACHYEFTLRINFAATQTRETVRQQLAAMRTSHPRKQLATLNPLQLPVRFWERLLQVNGIAADVQWAGVSGATLNQLADALTAADFAVVGKSMNKEEFVTCGGVRLREIEFKTMESKLCPGLHFAGEVLDIDGITGGFNFQAAWTTGRLAGLAMAN